MRGRKKVYLVIMKSEIIYRDEVKVKSINDIVEYVKSKRKFEDFYFIRKRTGKIEYYVKKVSNNKLYIKDLISKSTIEVKICGNEVIKC